MPWPGSILKKLKPLITLNKIVYKKTADKNKTTSKNCRLLFLEFSLEFYKSSESESLNPKNCQKKNFEKCHTVSANGLLLWPVPSVRYTCEASTASWPHISVDISILHKFQDNFLLSNDWFSRYLDVFSLSNFHEHKPPEQVVFNPRTVLVWKPSICGYLYSKDSMWIWIFKRRFQNILDSVTHDWYSVELDEKCQLFIDGRKKRRGSFANVLQVKKARTLISSDSWL